MRLDATSCPPARTVRVGRHSCVVNPDGTAHAQEGTYAQPTRTSRTTPHLHPLRAAVPEAHLLSLQEQQPSGECGMRIGPRRSRIGFGFLLGVLVTVDVLLLAAMYALHSLHTWLAL